VSKVFSEDMIIDILNTVRLMKEEQARIVSIFTEKTGSEEGPKKRFRLFGLF